MYKKLYSVKPLLAFLLLTIGVQNGVNAQCSVIYQSTTSTATGGTDYRYIRTLNPADGTGGATIYNGVTGPCYNAITGTTLTRGSVLTTTAAVAFDKNSNRLYFVNNTVGSAEDLSYIDLNASPVSAKRFVGYKLETNTNSGYNINRMTFAADGYGYALTSNAKDLIRFSVDSSTSIPVISRLGTLVNDAVNGSNNILAETGGDIFGDAYGKLYIIVNSGKLYKIAPATRITTYLGTINPMPSGSLAFQSIAADSAGNVYIGGNFQDVYKVDLASLNITSVTGGSTTNVWTSGDYASCALPILTPGFKAEKSYMNTAGSTSIVAGDTVEYTIEVTNVGNISAAGVRLYDSIPAGANYFINSTTLNGVSVADVNGLMPFSGGGLINSPGEWAGIIKPGTANKAVIKFRILTAPAQTICNQALVYMPGSDDYIIVKSDDPAQPGSEDSTCFWSAEPACQTCLTSTARVSSNVASVRVQPNPFVQELNMQVKLNTANTVRIRLVDFYGRTVYTTSQKLGAGVNALHISVPAGLGKGIYVLELSAGNNRLYQQKLLKQ